MRASTIAVVDHDDSYTWNLVHLIAVVIGAMPTVGVVIRSLVVRRHGRRHGSAWCYEYGTGGGITVGSSAKEEFGESRWKADRLIASIH